MNNLFFPRQFDDDDDDDDVFYHSLFFVKMGFYYTRAIIFTLLNRNLFCFAILDLFIPN